MYKELSFRKKLKIFQAICGAILKNENKILFVDGSNTITIKDFERIINESDYIGKINYVIDDNKIYFSNDSVIEIYQTDKDDKIRGKRSKLPIYYDTYLDREEIDKVILKFTKTE